MGQITNAPNSYYLHIHDKANTNVANANWNTQSASDHFTYTGTGLVPWGLSQVILTFFWIAEGDSNAYGQVYYSADGGAWTPTGQPKYYNQSKWQYESIQDPGMSNVQNLQIGFRWINPVTSDSTDVSFGIDDIIMVGNYDSINNPVQIYTAILDSPICQGGQQTFYMGLSEPLCDGTYEVEMSNANGNFSNPYRPGYSNPWPYFYRWLFWHFGHRWQPERQLFPTADCANKPFAGYNKRYQHLFQHSPVPNEIFNLVAPVMNDVDTTCILSEIDVMFNSIGVFHPGNTYIAELSDSMGSFTDSTVLGTLPVTDSFPSMPPGDVSGLIPASVPPGCGYYIRVVSTKPYTVSPPIGPYCLVDCDELTNNHTDIHFCVASGPYPQCDTIDIKPHEWNNQSTYDTCNKWIIQLRSMMDFSLVNQGGIGVYYDSIGGFFKLCMPSTADSLAVAPGEYYMRIVSTCSNETWNETGTVIRITIGAPSSTPSVLSIAPDSVVCNTASIYVTASPWNDPPSQYQWSSNLLNNGDAFIWPYNPLGVTLNSNVAFSEPILFTYRKSIMAAWAILGTLNVTIIGNPKVNITGPSQVCWAIQ